MAWQPYTRTWVSHSKIQTFLECPRAYYLTSVFKLDSGLRISLATPAMSYGSLIHNVIDTQYCSRLPGPERFRPNLLETFEKMWEDISGRKGGFESPEQEARYKERGKAVISKLIANPGVLKNPAIKIKRRHPDDTLCFPLNLSQPDTLPPRVTLCPENELILCGQVDWVEYMPANDSCRIIDFKTGDNQNQAVETTQLGIYLLLAERLLNKPVTELAIWHIETDDSPKNVPLPNVELVRSEVIQCGKQIKSARESRTFACPSGGCRRCEPLEKIVRGQGCFTGRRDAISAYYYIPPIPLPEPAEALEKAIA